MKFATHVSFMLLVTFVTFGCNGDSDATSDSDDEEKRDAATDVRLRADVEPVTSVQDAQKGVFIPPFLDCREPLDGEIGDGPDGKVCTHVAISGCTEAGKRFDRYASCDIVRTQRPFWPVPPAKKPEADDPRVNDKAFMKELAWVKEQVQASGCVCCHSSQIVGGTAGEWDIDQGPIWLDTLSDSGLALFTGLADSSVLGAYPAKDNHGFDRTITGIPTTDSDRMKTFMLAELQRRGITQAEAKKVPPFGGPIYANRVAKPTACGKGEGVDDDGHVLWTNGAARYVYILENDTQNPGVPPNLDLPEGTLWRLDVLASEAAIRSGVAYGTTPKGSFQSEPQMSAAPELARGRAYHLYVLKDVGLPIANCTFELGDVESASDAGERVASSDAGAACGADGGNSQGFGIPCKTNADCPCAANYCALQPGQDGYCSVTGCKEDATVCPKDWSCFDVSMFAAGQPAICIKP